MNDELLDRYDLAAGRHDRLQQARDAALARVAKLEAALREIRDVWLVHGPSRELSDVVARHAADVTEL